MIYWLRFRGWLERFRLHDERGAELIEWALVTLIVGLAGYALLFAIREELGRFWMTALDRFVDFVN